MSPGGRRDLLPDRLLVLSSLFFFLTWNVKPRAMQAAGK